MKSSFQILFLYVAIIPIIILGTDDKDNYTYIVSALTNMTQNPRPEGRQLLFPNNPEIFILDRDQRFGGDGKYPIIINATKQSNNESVIINIWKREAWDRNGGEWRVRHLRREGQNVEDFGDVAQVQYVVIKN